MRRERQFGLAETSLSATKCERGSALLDLGRLDRTWHHGWMADRKEHPYSIDVRRCWRRPGRFVCSILEKGEPRRYGPTTYATFDEARRAAQVRLRQLVFEWQLMGH